MSRSYHHHHHHANRPPIIVNDNDVLSGRGVNIAHHAGNERFRTLVSSRADSSYCTSYSASEKRAVAEEIIKHIQGLDPPGRFLKREGRGQVSRGLNGPWEVLSDREAIKKTCQALRDCNRQDRTGYAIGVAAPQDVIKESEKRSKSGLSGKQQAAAAAAASAAAAAAAASATLKRNREHMHAGHVPIAVGVPHVLPPHHHLPGPETDERVSPSVENAAEWLTTKKQRAEDGSALPAHSPVGADGMPLAPHPGVPVAAPGPEHNHHAAAALPHHHDPAAMHHVYHHDHHMVNGGAHHHAHVPAPAAVHHPIHAPVHHHAPVPHPPPPHPHPAVPAPAPPPVHSHAPVPAPASVHYSPVTDPNVAHPPHEEASVASEPVAAPQAAEPEPEVGPDVADTDPLNNLDKEDAPPLNITEL